MENKKNFIGENLTIQKAANILSCYKEGDALVKAYNDSIAKAEGARGGKVIGHTKSGKPIYESANHEAHKNFSIAEHDDAIKVHEKVRDDYHKNNNSTDEDKKANDNAFEQQKHHIGAKNGLMKDMTPAEARAAVKESEEKNKPAEGKSDQKTDMHIDKRQAMVDMINKEKEEKNKPDEEKGKKIETAEDGSHSVEHKGSKYHSKPDESKEDFKERAKKAIKEDHKDDVEFKKSEEEEIFDERTLALENGLILLKSFDHSHLVQKKVQVRGKDGSVHYAIRYVNPETGQSQPHPHASGNYSHIVDSDVAKIEAIISGGGTGIQKARDLADMGIYDKKVLLVLSGAHPPQISSVLKDMDVASVQSNPSSKPVPAEHTGENMPVSDGNGFPPPNLGDLSKNQLKRVLESQRSKLRSDAGLTYKDFWGSYERTLKGVIMDGYPKSLIAYGTGGLGKTYTLDKVMEANQVRVYDQEINPSSDQYDAVVIKGGTGIRDMWTIICKNRDKLIVFDDCDSMWDPSQESAQNILKGMLDTTGDGSVRYGQAGKDEDGIQLPKQIKFTGQVIFVSNLKREAFPQPLISSRCGAIDLTMSKDETLDKLLEIKDHVKLRGKGGAELEIPTASRDAAYDFFQRHKNQLDIGQVNARLFAQVAQVHKMMSADNDLASFEKEAMIRTNLV